MRILIQLAQDNNLKRSFLDLEDLANQLVSHLNTRKGPNLMILDEAGFLNFNMLRHFRSLAGRTKKTTGYVISGSNYFIKSLKSWIADEISGMKELDTRIDLYVKLLPPSYKEKKFVCLKA